MKFSKSAIFLAFTCPLVEAFAPQKFQVQTAVIRPSSVVTLMSDDDDWYADYDESSYGSYNNDNDYNSYGGGRSFGGRGRGNSGGRGGQRGGGRRGGYTRDTSRDNSNVDEDAVMDLINQRTEARRNRDFDAADAIREDLMHNYSVGIDDRENTWRTGCSASGSGMRFGGGGRGRDRDGGRGGRGGRGGGRRQKDFGPNGHDYELSADASENTSQLSEEEIHSMLADRLQAKMSRNFQVADSIQMELIDSGVFVHDGMKEWRADGVPYGSFEGGRGPGRTAGSRSDRDRGYTKSPYSADLEGVADSLIDGLVEERLKFKMSRQYDKADAVREGLRTKFNVLIDDRVKQWSVGGDFGEEHNMQRQIADKFAQRGYIKSTSSLSLSEEDEQYIQEQVDERSEAKQARDFNTADDIREFLQAKYDVTINDKMKLWSIGGIMEELGGKAQKPRGVYTRRGGGDLSDEDLETIQNALTERYQAKRNHDFDTADSIRDHLMKTYSIRIDDRSSEWHVDSDEYTKIGSEHLSEEDVAYIDEQLVRRHEFKRDRYYEEADAIREELREKFGVEIDDRTKEWRSEGVAEYSIAEENDEEEDEDLEDALDDALDSLFAEDDDDDENDASDDSFDEEEEEEVEEDIVAAEEEENASFSEEELSKLTVPVLKEKLKEAGLPVSGKKAELISRLLA